MKRKRSMFYPKHCEDLKAPSFFKRFKLPQQYSLVFAEVKPLVIDERKY
jgi:hypothetical protein